MKKKTALWLCCCLAVLGAIDACRAEDQAKPTDKTIGELDAYWAEVSRCVNQGDFKGYAATCHPQGVLVSGVKKTSYPLAQALARWKQGFDDTRAKRMTASVEFRFSQRLHGAATAHETGIFRYSSQRDGEQTVDYIRFEGLLQKSTSGWQIMMEYQKSETTEAEWNKLSPSKSQESD